MSESQNHAQEATLVNDSSSSIQLNGGLNKLSQPAGNATTTVVVPVPLLPLYIPYEPENNTPRPSRTLVLCFDGTGDQFDSDNSNIVQLVTMLKKDDKDKQMVYYQAGIGTYTSPAIATPLMSKLSKMLDEMFAWNLDAHVMGGYEFLMKNYHVGDKICIFGFSRGAYTARSLAGMIHKVGLIPADNLQQVPFAYHMYTKANDKGWTQSNAFKLAFSVDVKIEFIGVWDTVDSVGLIPKRLPFTTSNTIVKTFRHAVSLDEHRAKFKANLWNKPDDKEKNLGVDHNQANKDMLQQLQVIDDSDVLLQSPVISTKPQERLTLFKLNSHEDGALNFFESLYSDKSAETNVKEVWFAGCHCDVGGGSVENGTRHSLARIPLRWMVRECFKANTGILFETASLYGIGLDPNTLYPVVLPRPRLALESAKGQIIAEPESTSWFGWLPNLFTSAAAKKKAEEQQTNAQTAFVSEEDEDLRDALSPIYDQLTLKWGWWLLELLPVSMRYQTNDNQWTSEIGINMGKGRNIPEQDDERVNIHRSVLLRKQALHKDGSKYHPKAEYKGKTTWID